MRIIFFLIVVFSALIFNSCNNEEFNNSTDAETKNISVKISTLKTKAVGDKVPTGTITKIEDALILFYADNLKVFTHEFSSEEIDALKQEAAAGSVTIGGVPQSANKIAMIVNYKASGQGTSYDGVSENAVVNVEKLQPESEVQKVIMYGNGIIGTQPIAENLYSASVTVNPIASRIEIKSIGAKQSAGGVKKGEISSYTLVGVFIPNHYPVGKISECIGDSGTGSGSLVKPTDPKNYTNLFPFETGLSGYLNDYNNSNGLTISENKIFGYNVFPAIDAVNLPNIVIAVKDVQYISDDLNTESLLDFGKTKYVTVTDYYTNPDKTTVLDQIKNANVYGISNLQFGLSDLGDEPYSKAKNVEVVITITPWTYMEIYPGI